MTETDKRAHLAQMIRNMAASSGTMFEPLPGVHLLFRDRVLFRTASSNSFYRNNGNAGTAVLTVDSLQLMTNDDVWKAVMNNGL